ncbi:MAG: hypothetical protein ACMXYC_04530 [Candidatus Woesearchaeota archaeon]
MMYDEELTGFERALNEIKRIDHLIYVSLKYTRTVDVIRNIIQRMLNAYDFIFEDLLTQAEAQQKIFEKPTVPSLKLAALKKLHKDDAQLMEHMEFYAFLRQLMHAPYEKRQEYRRHVTMTSTFPNAKQHEINIDIISEYYHKIKAFFEYMQQTYR